jgi:transposase
MRERSAIGIDPDSKGFVCALVRSPSATVITKGYMATEADLESFLRWVKTEGEVIVAIEGSNGLSRPIEKTLREAGIIFYSFAPADTERFRKAVLGENKNNEKDAESVARYAMAMESQGKLQKYRRVWFADLELRLLSRSYERKSEAATAEVNRLWKLLRHASPELYLAFGGNHPEINLNKNMLDTQGILGLFTEKPNVWEWKDLSEEGFLQAMGGNCKGRDVLIQELRKVGACVKPFPPSTALIIQTSARLIAQLKRDQSAIVKMMDDMTAHSRPVQTLKEIRGIATVTASTVIAEIIDIRRFAREDNLASYSGLGMKEHSTGESTRMVATQSFNHRLKDAFMTAARNFLTFNPDSHLSGYHRNLVKSGMHPLEANKRVARALVRVIYRKLASLVEAENGRSAGEKDCQVGESGMASGFTRSGQSHTSNMPLSSQRHDKARDATEIKGGVRSTRKTKNSARGRRTSKKTA